MNYIKKHLYWSEYWIIGSNPRQNSEGTTKFFANTLKIFTRTLWSFRNDPWTSKRPRFPKSSSSKHPDTVAGNGAAQVSHCAILSPDVCVRCFPEPGLRDTKVRSAPGFSLACEKGEGKRKSKIVANVQLQSLVQNGFCYVCVQLDRGNVGGWWIDGHRVSRANVKRAPMRRNCMGTTIVSGSHFERHRRLPWCMQMRDKDVSEIQDRISLLEFLVLMHLEGG